MIANNAGTMRVRGCIRRIKYQEPTSQRRAKRDVKTWTQNPSRSLSQTSNQSNLPPFDFPFFRAEEDAGRRNAFLVQQETCRRCTRRKMFTYGKNVRYHGEATEANAQTTIFFPRTRRTRLFSPRITRECANVLAGACMHHNSFRSTTILSDLRHPAIAIVSTLKAHRQ